MTSPASVQVADRKWRSILGAFGNAALMPILILLSGLSRLSGDLGRLSRWIETYSFPLLMAGVLVGATVVLRRSLRIAPLHPPPSRETSGFKPQTPFQELVFWIAFLATLSALYLVSGNFEAYSDFLRARTPLPDSLTSPWTILIILCCVQFIGFLWLGLKTKRP